MGVADMQVLTVWSMAQIDLSHPFHRAAFQLVGGGR